MAIQTCEQRPPQFNFMQFDSSTPASAMELYQWVESNVGSFDVNDTSAQIPSAGVSIRSSDGKMIISHYGNLVELDQGDYVVEQNWMGQKQYLKLTPSAFETQYRTT